MNQPYNLLAAVRPDMDATIEADLAQAGVPSNVLGSLLDYVRYGRPVGGFLSAVLEGNLFEAAVRADGPNRAKIGDIARAIVWHFPQRAFGSVANVKAWRDAAVSQNPGKLRA